MKNKMVKSLAVTMAAAMAVTCLPATSLAAAKKGITGAATAYTKTAATYKITGIGKGQQAKVSATNSAVKPAVVTKNGGAFKVTPNAKAAGTTITVKAVIQKKNKKKKWVTAKTYTKKVKVYNKATSVAMNKKTAAIYVKGSVTLKATVKPTKTKPVTWKSSNAKVAKVVKGKVTGVKAGTATITATVDGKKATSKVTVYNKVSSVKITGVDHINVGATTTLKATIAPTSGVKAADKKVTWTSSDKSIATVDKNGVVTGIKPGTVKITAKAGGKTATTTIAVNEKAVAVTGVAIDTEKPKAGQEINAVVSPENATNATYAWSVNGVDAGVTTSKFTVPADAKAGDVIKVVVTDGTDQKTYEATVTVVEAVKVAGVKIDNNKPETTDVLTATVDPEAATVDYQWLADGSAIAGATEKTFTVTADQIGKAIQVQVTGKGDYADTATSSATEKVAAKVIKAEYDKDYSTEKATLTTGDVINIKLTPEAADKDVTVQWFRGTNAVSGATGLTYTVTAADAGNKLHAEITPFAGKGYDTKKIVLKDTVEVKNDVTEWGLTLSAVDPTAEIESTKEYKVLAKLPTTAKANDDQGWMVAAYRDEYVEGNTTKNIKNLAEGGFGATGATKNVDISVGDDNTGGTDDTAQVGIFTNREAVISFVPAASDVGHNIIFVVKKATVNNNVWTTTGGTALTFTASGVSRVSLEDTTKGVGAYIYGDTLVGSDITKPATGVPADIDYTNNGKGKVLELNNSGSNACAVANRLLIPGRTVLTAGLTTDGSATALATLNNAKSDATVTYKWQISTNAGGTFTDIEGATEKTYTVPADLGVEATVSGKAYNNSDVQYRCVITGTGSYKGELKPVYTGMVAAKDQKVGIVDIQVAKNGANTKTLSQGDTAEAVFTPAAAANGVTVYWFQAKNGNIVDSVHDVYLGTGLTYTIPDTVSGFVYPVVTLSASASTQYALTETADMTAKGSAQTAVRAFYDWKGTSRTDSMNKIDGVYVGLQEEKDVSSTSTPDWQVLKEAEVSVGQSLSKVEFTYTNGESPASADYKTFETPGIGNTVVTKVTPAIQTNTYEWYLDTIDSLHRLDSDNIGTHVATSSVRLDDNTYYLGSGSKVFFTGHKLICKVNGGVGYEGATINGETATIGDTVAEIKGIAVTEDASSSYGERGLRSFAKDGVNTNQYFIDSTNKVAAGDRLHAIAYNSDFVALAQGTLTLDLYDTNNSKNWNETGFVADNTPDSSVGTEDLEFTWYVGGVKVASDKYVYGNGVTGGTQDKTTESKDGSFYTVKEEDFGKDITVTVASKSTGYTGEFTWNNNNNKVDKSEEFYVGIKRNTSDEMLVYNNTNAAANGTYTADLVVNGAVVTSAQTKADASIGNLKKGDVVTLRVPQGWGITEVTSGDVKVSLTGVTATFTVENDPAAGSTIAIKVKRGTTQSETLTWTQGSPGSWTISGASKDTNNGNAWVAPSIKD